MNPPTMTHRQSHPAAREYREEENKDEEKQKKDCIEIAYNDGQPSSQGKLACNLVKSLNLHLSTYLSLSTFI